AGAKVRLAKLELCLSTAAGRFDAELERRAQEICSLVESERGARRLRRAEVVIDRQLAVAERGGGGEVVGEVGEHPSRLLVRYGDRVAHEQMQLRATVCGEPVIDRAPDELVCEAVGERRPRNFLEHAAANRIVERPRLLDCVRRGASEHVEL